ncbi:MULTISPECIES: phenylacetate--CoA ligase family protein [Chryseobacterium]|uniref:Phenylacetate-CoA ligase n=1 Tax=Chryseobacterium camelliae TaxID=1265445 RepID=A0ABU0TNQ5_9FLAO|nr:MULTISPECIES: AMP-binding protein [Chryseobacterium]MDT3408206.1 phenylacetate-CoA ligase [Pseudacidovorax intermedius]MDQ1097940.1 phenylacetate-CoA ligase [Chryseobacterium camelliae]MDQ1101871.1 phenylacetate-CoA ligase [Chryseobacterium sp. SORGH_AS_1048]MDR6085311.1 phenylacetate-CoA ligase [Chryseobacterium sp. SORGH_AS_0909]MDR6129668.1 phenylacetate-CoA ligase [Chryseobacterium sp. SORGH_AS_1175]
MELYPSIEKADIQEIKKFQEQKLRELLIYLQDRSPFYQRLFKDNSIHIHDIRTLEDLQKIPVTTKDDLQQYNHDFFCITPDKIVDYSTTSGTLGDPVTFGLSDQDLERLSYNEAVSFACAGIKKGDVVQMITTIDKRFMAGLAYFLGLRKMGASVVRMGPGIPELQWDSIFRYQPKYLITVPSFLLKMIDYAEKNGIDYKNSSVYGAVCIGESIKNQDFTDNILSKKIKEKWDIQLFSTYASTEMSTAFTECEFQAGGHHHPELIITEILDDSGNPIAEGESGELTITTLGVEAMPLLRFKTGDIVQAHYEPCRCGRNTMRLGPVIGRKQQMIKYKGTTLYPPAMHDILNDFSGIQCYQIVIHSSDIGLDEIIIKLSSEHADEEFVGAVKDHFRAKLRVSPKIELVDFDVLSKEVFHPNSRKPITLVDLR